MFAMSAYRYCEFCEERFPAAQSHSASTCAARQRRARVEAETANDALRQENMEQANRVIAQQREIAALRQELDRCAMVYGAGIPQALGRAEA